MPAIVAHLASEQEVSEEEYEMKMDDEQVLGVLATDATISQQDIAKKFLWSNRKEKPDKSRSQRAIERLRKNGLIEKNNTLTPIGTQRLKRKGANGSDIDGRKSH
jgi:hypothetical protein